MNDQEKMKRRVAEYMRIMMIIIPANSVYVAHGYLQHAVAGRSRPHLSGIKSTSS